MPAPLNFMPGPSMEYPNPHMIGQNAAFGQPQYPMNHFNNGMMNQPMMSGPMIPQQVILDAPMPVPAPLNPTFAPQTQARDPRMKPKQANEQQKRPAEKKYDYEQAKKKVKLIWRLS